MNLQKRISFAIILEFYLVLCVQAWKPFSIFGSPKSATETDNLRNELERIKEYRHVENRRELEREARPFLEKQPLQVPTSILKLINDLKVKKLPQDVSDASTNWFDFFSTFTAMDLVMMMFSSISLVFGTVYIIWRHNPLASKVEK